MPKISIAGRNGRWMISLTALPKQTCPCIAFAFVHRCSARKRPTGTMPVSSLATSPAAEGRFSSVRTRWIGASRRERAAMRTELTEIEQWLEKTDDGLEPVARAYLAVAWLDADVPNAAEAVARPLYQGPPGVTHDLGVLVQGIALRRTGHATGANATRQPLVGKLIDAL